MENNYSNIQEAITIAKEGLSQWEKAITQQAIEKSENIVSQIASFISNMMILHPKVTFISSYKLDNLFLIIYGDIYNGWMIDGVHYSGWYQCGGVDIRFVKSGEYDIVNNTNAIGLKKICDTWAIFKEKYLAVIDKYYQEELDKLDRRRNEDRELQSYIDSFTI